MEGSNREPIVRKTPPLRKALAALVLLACAACGGGSKGDDDGDIGAVVETCTVGGTVVGLDGALILQNNGGDDLTITADGPFVFDTPLSRYSPYLVTIQSGPLQQEVTISNGAGTIYSEDVTSILVICVDKGWTHPSDLSDNISPDGQSAFSPNVAVGDNRNALIVWRQWVGNRSQIFKSEYRDGIWNHPADLSDNISPNGESAWYAQAAMDNRGDAIVVWYQSVGLYNRIYKSEYRDGNWTHPSDLSDGISPDLQYQEASSAYAAMDNKRNALIVWYQYDGGPSQIFKSEYRQRIWAHPSGLSDNISPDGQSAYAPQAVMDDNGNALVVWMQSDGNNDQIFKSEYRGGFWTDPADLADNISPDGQPAFSPEVAMDNNGNAIIVWYQRDGNYHQIYKSEYRGGIWTHPAGLSDSISPKGQDAKYPEAAMDNNGNALVVWHQSEGNSTQIFLSEYRGGVWTHPADLSDSISPDGQRAEYPEAAMDNNGDALIVWNQFDGIGSQVFKSEYRQGVWIHPADLSDNISPDGTFVRRQQVAMDDSGSALVVWQQIDDNGVEQIFKSEYH